MISGHYEPGSYYILANGVNIYENGFIVSQDSSLSVNGTGNLAFTSEVVGFEFSPSWVEYDAFITQVLSDTRFIAGTVEVQLLATTEFEGGSKADLTLNQLVEVKDRKLNSGIVQAVNIEFEDQGAYLNNSNSSNSSSSSSESMTGTLSSTVVTNQGGVAANGDSNPEESIVYADVTTTGVENPLMFTGK